MDFGRDDPGGNVVEVNCAMHGSFWRNRYINWDGCFWNIIDWSWQLVWKTAPMSIELEKGCACPLVKGIADNVVVKGPGHALLLGRVEPVSKGVVECFVIKCKEFESFTPCSPGFGIIGSFLVTLMLLFVGA